MNSARYFFGGCSLNYPSVRSICAPYDVIRVALGSLLIIAAMLKAHQIVTEPIIAPFLFFSATYFQLLVVESELFLGIWLISGVYQRASWYMATGFFAVFALFSLGSLLTGEKSCGCLGTISVNPLHMLLLDVTILAVLLKWSATSRISRTYAAAVFRRAMMSVAVYLITGLPIAVIGANAYSESELVMRDPQQWIGRPFPLLSSIDAPVRLGRGEWLLVFWRHDCGRCSDLLAGESNSFAGSAPHLGGTATVLVEVPPFGPPAHQLALLRTAPQARLTTQRRWPLRTPLFVTIRDGSCVSVRED